MSSENEFFSTEHLTANIGSRAARGGAITMGGQGCKLLLTVLSQVVLARLLTPQQYGLVGMVAVVTGFIAIFKDLGLSMATIQSPHITHRQVTFFFWVNIAASGLLTLLTLASAPLIAAFNHEPALINITFALAFGFLISGASAQHLAILTRKMQYGTLLTIELTALACSFGAGVWAAWAGAGYWALVLIELVRAGIVTVLAWSLCRWRPGVPARCPEARTMLLFGGNLTGFTMVNYLARNFDNVLIGWRWGAGALGLYAKAYQMLLLPLSQINGPLQNVAVPTLSRLADDPDRYRRAYLRILDKLAVGTIPLMVLFSCTSDWIVELLLGPAWSGAVPIFRWLAVIGLVQPVMNTTGWLFITQGRTQDMFRWGITGSSISIASFFIGLPWGATGVAMSYSLIQIGLGMPLLFWFVGCKGPIRTRDFYRTIAFPIGASLAVFGGIVALRLSCPSISPLLGCLSAAAITLAIYPLTLFATRSGRATIQDTLSMLTHLRKRSAPQAS